MDAIMEWELSEGGWFVVEFGGKLKTGPFDTKEDAHRFYLEELETTLPEDMKERSKP